MQMELSYIHMAVRLATCNILKFNYSSWSRDWIQMIAVKEVGTRLKSQANQKAVTKDRKQTKV